MRHHSQFRLADDVVRDRPYVRTQDLHSEGLRPSSNRYANISDTHDPRCALVERRTRALAPSPISNVPISPRKLARKREDEVILKVTNSMKIIDLTTPEMEKYAEYADSEDLEICMDDDLTIEPKIDPINFFKNIGFES